MLGFILGALLPSLIVSWIAAALVRSWGPQWGFLDQPDPRKVHSEPTPTAGGLAIWLGIIIPLVIGQWILWHTSGLEETYRADLLQQSSKFWSLLAGGTALMILGLVDDRRSLDWQTRLVIQSVIALVMVLEGWRLTISPDWPLLTGIISIVWIVGLINSFNMLDNMDGLSAGVAAIAGTMLALLVFTAPGAATNLSQLFLGGFLLVLVGSLLGFLEHNRPTARLFMGDTGSYLIGYLLATTTLATASLDSNVAQHMILAPLCILAVPLYDTVSVILIRLLTGRSPFEADKCHFSHRLVDRGMTKTQAVLTIYLATAICGLGAFALREVDAFGALLVGLLEAGVLILIIILETAGRSKL